MALVTSLLGAMKNGSKEAKQLFPRLLQIVEKFPSTQAAFIKKVRVSFVVELLRAEVTLILSTVQGDSVLDVPWLDQSDHRHFGQTRICSHPRFAAFCS